MEIIHENLDFDLKETQNHPKRNTQFKAQISLKNLIFEEEGKSINCNKESFDKKIGKALKTIRLQKNKTQLEVCYKVNIKQPQLSAYEQGLYSVPYDILFNISKALEVNPAHFAFKIFMEYDSPKQNEGESIDYYKCLLERAEIFKPLESTV